MNRPVQSSKQQDPPVDPVSWIDGRSLDELEFSVVGGQILARDEIRYRALKGQMKKEPVLIRAPLMPDLVSAKIDAIRFVAKQASNPEITTMDAAVAVVGRSYFEQLDNYGIVARCTHEHESCGDEMPPQYKLFELLLADHPPMVIDDLLEHMALLKKFSNPRLIKLSEADFWRACGAIATKGNISPLGDMSEDTWHAFIVETCARLWLHRTPSS